MKTSRPPKSRFRRSRLVIPACLVFISVAEAQQGNRTKRRITSNQQAFITRKLEKSVDRGLKFLASRQDRAGYWAQDIGFKLNTGYNVTKRNRGHVGVSALALMSFLAGGHVPGRGEYGDNLDRGLKYLLRCVKENGYIQDNGSRMYSHAFATLLFAEIYGMTRRRDVRDALQRAITVIVDSQNAEGGWRYQLFARESDMSITVCQVMALRSARNVGITVPISTITRAQNYVIQSSVQGRGRRGSFLFRGHGIVNSGGAFRYQLRSNSRATFPLTAAGVTTLYAAGNYDSSLIDPALEYLRSQMNMFNSYFGRTGHYFYYYGHYYAVQAFFVAGGSHWRTYFVKMRTELLSNQRSDGSWPSDTGPGEAFSTAVATLILQIPYQYLPIFQR
ncbi:MAG: prenyltransferase [Planctomycetota bacterium]|nr:prenyltransferase [Planctomycetota bacterium]